MTEMFVAGAVLDAYTNTPVLVLMDNQGKLILPIGIGEAECNAICFAMAGLTAARPQTHDLLLNTVDALGWDIKQVEITSVRSRTYFADIRLEPKDKNSDLEIPIDARPSDAIAVAIRAQAPIYVAEEVLEFGAFTLGDEDGDPAFHNFVQNAKASDFNKWFTSHNK